MSSKYCLSIFLLLWWSSAFADTPNLGKLLSDSEILHYSITVFPDGSGLPEGSGTAEQGKIIYSKKCAACHGIMGTEGPATRLAGPLQQHESGNPLLAMSVTSVWPSAPSIFDYIRRGMPPTSTKSLSNDETYALTAYILYLGDLIKKSEVINAAYLPRIKMPVLENSIEKWDKEKSYYE